MSNVQKALAVLGGLALAGIVFFVILVSIATIDGKRLIWLRNEKQSFDDEDMGV